MAELEEVELEGAEEEDFAAAAVSTSGHRLLDPADSAGALRVNAVASFGVLCSGGTGSGIKGAVGRCCREGMMPRAEWQQCCPMPNVWAVAGPVQAL